MTTDPATAKTYSYYGSNNQLYTVPSPYTVFSYDALDRLASFNTGAPVTNYVNEGTNPIAEYDGSNVLQKRYAFDPGSGEPLVAYDASGNRTWMVGDERGSIIALANDSGAMTSINSYDEYGIPGAANAGTFQYAGMLWLSRPGVYAPTYRAYGAHLGRFSQTDPIGFGGGVNLYNYTGGDPVNLMDLLGLDQTQNKPPCVEKNGQLCPDPSDQDCTGTRLCGWGSSGLPVTSTAGAASVFTTGRGSFSSSITPVPADIIVTAAYAGIPYDPGQPVLSTAGTIDTNAALREIVVRAYKTGQLAGVPIDWNLPPYQEQRWVVFPGIRVEYVGIAEGKPLRNGAVAVPVPNLPGIIAIIHTHPNWSFSAPGIGDYGHPIPIYGVTMDSAWVVEVGARRGIYICLAGVC